MPIYESFALPCDLSIDSGDTHVVPIYEGFALPHTIFQSTAMLLTFFWFTPTRSPDSGVTHVVPIYGGFALPHAISCTYQTFTWTMSSGMPSFQPDIDNAFNYPRIKPEFIQARGIHNRLSPNPCFYFNLHWSLYITRQRTKLLNSDNKSYWAKAVGTDIFSSRPI